MSAGVAWGQHWQISSIKTGLGEKSVTFLEPGKQVNAMITEPLGLEKTQEVKDKVHLKQCSGGRRFVSGQHASGDPLACQAVKEQTLAKP